MGVSFKRVLNQGVEALDRLARWGRLSSSELKEILSWTGERVGDVRMRFRSEIFVSRALRNPIVRGCPICLREDVENHQGNPFEALVLRGDWQLRETVICIRHSHPLVELWRSTQIVARFDIAARLKEILPAILNGDLDRPGLEQSRYDLWLDRRLAEGRDDTQLAQHSLYAATTFCRLLGAAKLGMTISDLKVDPLNLRAAQDTGFATASRGDMAIRAALESMAERADSGGDFPKKIFGQLFTKLSSDYINNEVFAPFRHKLRDCILLHWPVGPDEMVLGEALQERRLHSLSSTADETGVGVKVLE